MSAASEYQKPPPITQPCTAAMTGVVRCQRWMSRCAEALAMIAELRGVALLRGARGRPAADIDALADALVGVGRLAETHAASLRALDINPLVVLDEGRGAIAVDWLIEVGE